MSGSSGAAVLLTVAAPTTTVTNAGSITATGTSVAVRVTGAGVTINNSGTISSAANAIVIATTAGTGAANTTTIINSGTISATGTSGSAITAGTGGANSVGVVAITNTGTINITNAANTGAAIDLAGANTGTTVSSSGTISTAGSGAAILLGSSGTITLSGGTVSSAGTNAVNLGSAGTLNITGSVTMTGGVTGTGGISISSSGALTTGTAATTIGNTGTFSLASGGRLVVGSTTAGSSVTTSLNSSGAVSISGTIVINRASTANGGVLAFAGTPTFASTAQIIVGLPTTFTAGNVTVMTAAGGLPTTTTGASLSSGNPAYTISYAGSTSATSMVLTIGTASSAQAASAVTANTPAATAAAVSSSLSAVPATVTANLGTVAAQAQALLTTPTTSVSSLVVAELFQLVNGVVQYKPDAAAKIEQLAPKIAQAAASANAGASTSVGSTTGTVTQRAEAVRAESSGNYASAGVTSGMATAADSSRSRAVWFQGLATNTNQNARSSDPGYKGNGRGVVGGADYTFVNGALIGAALSYSKTDIAPKGTSTGNDTNMKSVIGLAYGSVPLGTNAYAEGQMGYGTLDFDTKRIVGTTLSQRSYKGTVAFGKATLGYNVNLSNNFTVTPMLLSDVTRIKTDEAVEYNGLRGTFGSTSNTGFRVGAGAKLNKLYNLEEGGRLSPELRTQYMYSTTDKGIDQSVTSYSGATAYTAPGLKPARGEYGLGTGLTFQTPTGISLSGNYDAGIKEKYLSHTFTGRARFTF
ncbi:MAG: autotransporter domain-containing protein [Proteobacteria bacterium]|nr:autotransporter domain-containing protein [Pseudomonadota bacterium]